jgi:hypothetical protein
VVTTHEATGTRGNTMPVQATALVVGAAFLLVGVAGFIPGLTTDLDTLTWAGHRSGSMLLGVFAVSVLHNVVHLAFGVAGVVACRSFRGARTYLIAGGLAYAVLWLYGVLIDHDGPVNFVPVNDADNWLHLGIAVGMIGSGALLGRYVIHTGTGAMGTPESARGTFPPGATAHKGRKRHCVRLATTAKLSGIRGVSGGRVHPWGQVTRPSKAGQSI